MPCLAHSTSASLLDPKQPNNDLPPLPLDPKQFETVAILRQLTPASDALSRLDEVSRRLPNSLHFMSPLLILESVASSGVENINTTPQEVVDLSILPAREQSPAAKEADHYQQAMIRGVVKILDSGGIATSHLIELQAIIEPSRPGIRRLPYHLENSATHAILYTPPQGEERLRGLMRNLEEYVNHSDGLHPLVRAAIIHHQFEAIHPFADGNGRVGRILALLYLVLERKLQYPCLYLSGYILAHRDEYYKVLHLATFEQHYEPLVLFFLSAVEVQATETAGRMRTLLGLIKSLEDASRDVRDPHGVVEQIFTGPYFTQKDLLPFMSKPTLIKYVRRLETEEHLASRKVGRQIYYFSPAFLALLSARS
jgi:Fic family protein